MPELLTNIGQSIANYGSWLCSSPLRKNSILRATQCDADIVLFDLEDSVPLRLKAAAREDVVTQLNPVHKRKFALRINALSTMEGMRDILWLAERKFNLDILVLSKVESAAEIKMLSQLLDGMGRKVEIFAIIETLEGLNEVERIAAIGGQLRGLILGAADISSQLGIKVDNTGRAMNQIKFHIAAAAARHGLLAIDSPCFTINDVAALRNELGIAREFGFSGKIAIHPSQVEAINQAFAPSESELQEAREVIRFIDESPHGIAEMKGKMIGPPFAKLARQIIKKGGSPKKPRVDLMPLVSV